MNYLQEKFEKLKVEREVNQFEESYGYREGYVKAMCDAINLVKNLHIHDVSNSVYCDCDNPTEYTDANNKTYCKWCGKDFKQ